jgi:hypothetical protein
MVVWTLTYCETCIEHQQRPFESPEQRSIDRPASELDLGSEYSVQFSQVMDMDQIITIVLTSMPTLDCRDSNWHAHRESCHCWQDHALHYRPSRPEQSQRNSIPCVVSIRHVHRLKSCTVSYVPLQTRPGNRQPEAASSQQKRSEHTSEEP